MAPMEMQNHVSGGAGRLASAWGGTRWVADVPLDARIDGSVRRQLEVWFRTSVLISVPIVADAASIRTDAGRVGHDSYSWAGP